MTIIEQLTILRRQFPNSRELAVSREMALDFEMEIVTLNRYTYHEWPLEYPPIEHYPGLRVEPLTLKFKDRSLTIVENV